MNDDEGTIARARTHSLASIVSRRELLAALAASTAACLVRAAPGRRDPVALADLVPAGDPLAAQDVTFDARFADVALQQLASDDARLLDRLAALPASEHLLRHAKQFDYDVPKESTGALVRHLLKPSADRAAHATACRASLAYFTGPLLDDPHWVGDVLRDLPAGFRFRGATLFLTYGYDIGVALAPCASLNGAHTKFNGHPRELVYYAIHELHHVGFMTCQAPLRIADLATCADVLRFVEYATQLEGMAVHAAWDRRRREDALAADGDYVALGDEAAMQAAEARYWEICESLRRRGTQKADAEALATIERLSSERLWYRVGARMAARIEDRLGHEALTALVLQGPEGFLDAYRRVAGRTTPLRFSPTSCDRGGT
jgi:hypothetical protein